MTDRIRSLLDAGIALTSELSLDALLQNLTETAAELTGARYAALRDKLPQLNVVGGCCGTDHRHIGEICSAFKLAR